MKYQIMKHEETGELYINEIDDNCGRFLREGSYTEVCIVETLDEIKKVTTDELIKIKRKDEK